MTQDSNLSTFEKNERYLATQLFKHIPTIESFSFTSGRICYDCLITTKEQKKILSEIKVRGFEVDKYPDYILHVDKLVGLIKKAKTNNLEIIYYINFFNHPKNEYMRDFIVFNLSERIKTWKTCKPIIIKKYMNAVTCQSRDVKVSKEVIMIKYDDKIDMKGTIICN